MHLTVFATFIVLVLGGLGGWRALDHLADRKEMKRLTALQTQSPDTFNPAMIADLPEPARRFFKFAIAEGTPLLPVAELWMTGQFSLGDKEAPRYMKMQAHQVLAMPHGSIWKVRMQSGHLRFSGSDSAAWTRFWMGGLLPVARQGGTADHARSAFGRYVAEAVFWAPAAVLPGPNIEWEQVDPNRARLTVRHNDMTQDVEITVAANGQPTQVVFPRWSNANPDQTYQVQPFGGTLSAFQEFQGYRLPTHVEAGNFFGTEDYFPFYIADVT
ncbi:MAG: DUF6544 family protein [Sulfitobacter sp.]